MTMNMTLMLELILSTSFSDMQNIQSKEESELRPDKGRG